MKIKEDDNKYIKILDNNDIIVYKHIVDIWIDQEIVLSIGDKSINLNIQRNIK